MQKILPLSKIFQKVSSIWHQVQVWGPIPFANDVPQVIFSSAELPRFSSPQSEDMWTKGKLVYKDWTGRGHPLDTFVQKHGKRERPGVNCPSEFWNLLNSAVSSFDLCACLLSRVRPVAIPSTAARQALLSMGFSRQEYWSGLPFPTPGYLPTQVSNLHLHLLHCRRILYH